MYVFVFHRCRVINLLLYNYIDQGGRGGGGRVGGAAIFIALEVSSQHGTAQ